MTTTRRARGARRRPRSTWVLAAMALAVFCCVLLTAGYVSSDFGVDALGQTSSGRQDRVPDSALEGGPVIDTRSEAVRSHGMKGKSIALTFDDGPDPTWTPRVLEVLRKHDIPATFFVVGAQASKHPDLLREMRASGSEIGLHTFTHSDLLAESAERQVREMSETQLALAGATGEISNLIRPPYSSVPGAIQNEHYAVLKNLGANGYVTALNDLDSEDWKRPGVDSIVKASTPRNGKGAIVLMHDAGGDRSQTVEALDVLIPTLKSKGYKFTTVTAGVGIAPANQKAEQRDAATGAGVVLAVGVSTVIVEVLTWLLVVAGALVILRLLVMVVFATYHGWRRNPRRWSWGPAVTEPVSVIVPAYNEKECIAATLRSLMACDHPIEVIVVDDGSTDETAAIVASLRLPGVRLVRQANAGKPAALNNGIRHARHNLIVMMDGDTVFEPATVRHLVQPFANPQVGAVSGNAKVANRSTLIGRWQHIEYVIGFNIDRRVTDLARCITTIPGAVGAFRRTALTQVGGVSEDTLAEDTDLTMAICAAGWRVVYEPNARAWTEAPVSFRQLWRQRYRWSYGTMQSMWKHRHAVFATGPAGRMGRVGLANLALFQVLLPCLAPLIDVFLIYGLLVLDPVKTLALWGAVLGLQMLVALLAFAMERENPTPILWMPLQQLAYRQMMYAVLIKSIGTAVAGGRLRWQKLKRVGEFGALSTPPVELPDLPPSQAPVPPAPPVRWPANLSGRSSVHTHSVS